MFLHLTNLTEAESACRHIYDLIRVHPEWFCTLGQAEAFALRRDEIDLTVSQERLIFSCWTDKGSKSWRIHGWLWDGQVLTLQASRRMGAELPLIELLPRASAKAVAATIKAARQVRSHKLAILSHDKLKHVGHQFTLSLRITRTPARQSSFISNL